MRTVREMFVATSDVAKHRQQNLCYSYCMSMKYHHPYEQYAPVWLSTFLPTPPQKNQKNSCIFTETDDDSTVHIPVFGQVRKFLV